MYEYWYLLQDESLDLEEEAMEGECSMDDEDEDTVPVEDERENLFKALSDNKDIAKLAALTSTAINSNKRVCNKRRWESEMKMACWKLYSINVYLKCIDWSRPNMLRIKLTHQDIDDMTVRTLPVLTLVSVPTVLTSNPSHSFRMNAGLNFLTILSFHWINMFSNNFVFSFYLHMDVCNPSCLSSVTFDSYHQRKQLLLYCFFGAVGETAVVSLGSLNMNQKVVSECWTWISSMPYQISLW